MNPQEASVSRPSILVVDDEADILESLGDMIRTCIVDVDVLTASSGEEAVRILEKEHVDVIITDYRMPGMNGLEFLVEAGRLAPRVTRVMITAYPDIDLVVNAINEGHVSDFLTKPFRGEAVLRVVAEALTERQAELEKRQRLVTALNDYRAQPADGSSVP